MTIETYLLNALAALLLVALARVAIIQAKSPLFPSAFFALYWAFALLLVLIFGADFDLWPGASWMLLLLAIVLHVGSLLGASSASANGCRTSDDRDYIFQQGKQWIVLLSLGGIFAALILIIRSPVSLQTIIHNPLRMIEVGQQYANLRYGYGQGSPLVVNLLNVLLYLACMLAGVWLATAQSFRNRLISSIPLLIGLLQSVLVSARTGFIWMCIVFAGSYAAVLVLQNDRLPNMKSIIVRTVMVVSLLAVFVFLIQISRHSLYSDPWSITFEIRVTMFGSPIVFSHWLRDNWYLVNPQFGTKTFGGIADMLGIAVRGQGLGWEGSSVVGFQGLQPNVYTAFRQLIEDFTLPGTIIAFLGLGLSTGLAYRRVMAGSVAWIPWLALFYGVTLGSYLANWLNYNTIVFSWILFFILFSLKRSPLLSEMRVFGEVRAQRQPNEDKTTTGVTTR